MARRFEHSEDDELSEILRRAVRKESATSSDLRQRLLAAADELGISHEAVAQAETECREEATRGREMAIYDKERRKGFQVHLVTFALVNFFLVGLNVMTFHEDHEIWSPIVLLSWGIGFGIHAFLTMRKTDWDDEEFQKWRLQRAAKAAIERGEFR